MKPVAKPEYCLGYHQAWEAWLHARRFQNAQEGKTENHKQEVVALDNWLRENWKVYDKPTLCNSCNDYIAECMLQGKPAFEFPGFMRQAIETFNEKFGKNFKARKAQERADKIKEKCK